MPASFHVRDPIPQVIQANGQDVVDIIMENWGSNVMDSYPEYLTSGAVVTNQPGFPFTPQAITIGPRSTIDRAWASWNYQASMGSTSAMVRYLSLDTPLLFPQAAGVGRVVIPGVAPLVLLEYCQAQNKLYIAPHHEPREITEAQDPGYGWSGGYQSTLLPDQYMDAAGALHDFYDQTGSRRVELPILHLQFHLRAPLTSPNPKRAPYFNGFQIPTSLGVGVEEMMYGWPVYGRKSITLQVRSDVAATTTFRVAALRNVQRYYRIQETTEGEQQSTAADESVRFRFCNLDADYLILYATRGTGAAPNILGTITAYD